MSDRFPLLDKPLVDPQQDMITKAPEGPVFDLGLDLDDRFGVAYLKVEHVEEMANTLGMLTKAQAQELYDRIELLESSQKLPEQVEELVNGIANLVSNYLGNPAPVGSSGINVPVYLADKEPSEGSESDSEESGESGGDNSDSPDELDKLVGDTSGQNSKSPKLKRPNNVPADSSDEFGFGNAGTAG